MQNIELGLIIVSANFVGALLLIYIGFKIYAFVTSRKSRNYRNIAPEHQETEMEMVGGYVVIDAPPIKPHYFARSYQFKSNEYELPEQRDKNKCEERPPDVPVAVTEAGELPKTTSV